MSGKKERKDSQKQRKINENIEIEIFPFNEQDYFLEKQKKIQIQQNVKRSRNKISKIAKSGIKNKKNLKMNRIKIKKIKKRTQKRDSNLYDINNFVVQNNTNKINEKKDFVNIPIPVFRELEDNYYQQNEFDEQKNNLDLNSDFLNNDVI